MFQYFLALLSFLSPSAIDQGYPYLGSGLTHAQSVSCATVADSQTGGVYRDFGVSAGASTVWTGVSFVAGSSYTLCKMSTRLQKLGSPTFNVTASIYTNVSSKPGVLVGTASGTVAASSLTTSYADIMFTGMSAALTSGVTYWIVLSTSAAGDGSNHLWWQTPSGSTTDYVSTDGSTWSGWDVDIVANFTSYR